MVEHSSFKPKVKDNVTNFKLENFIMQLIIYATKTPST